MLSHMGNFLLLLLLLLLLPRIPLPQDMGLQAEIWARRLGEGGCGGGEGEGGGENYPYV